MKLSELRERIFDCLEKCVSDDIVHIKETTNSDSEGFRAYIDITLNRKRLEIVVGCDSRLKNLKGGIEVSIKIFKESLVEMGFEDDTKEDTEPQKLMQEAKELLKKESIAPKDSVNNPSHYTQGSIECIDAMESMLTPEEFRGFLRGSIFKYQWRVIQKNGVEDLEKCQWYLNKLIERLKKLEVKND